MWDQRYSEPGFAYGTEPNEFLLASVSLLKPKGTILCLGEGEGRNAVYLASLGHLVTAVDASSVGLVKAQKLADESGVSIRMEKADLGDYPIEPGSFDAIISIFCQLPPSIRINLYKCVYGGLSHGGLFILEGYAKRQMEFDSGGPKNPELLMDLEEAKRELQPLKFTHAIELEREVHEGNYHNGTGVVIQVIGVKDDQLN